MSGIDPQAVFAGADRLAEALWHALVLRIDSLIEAVGDDAVTDEEWDTKRAELLTGLALALKEVFERGQLYAFERTLSVNGNGRFH